MSCNIPTKSDILKSVSNTDQEVVRHLAENFFTNMGFHTGVNKKLICPCVKTNVPFKVLQPIECSLTPDGNQIFVLEPGIYQILFSWIASPLHSVSLKRLDRNESDNLSIYVGWGKDQMIDWRGIQPVKI